MVGEGRPMAAHTERRGELAVTPQLLPAAAEQQQRPLRSSLQLPPLSWQATLPEVERCPGSHFTLFIIL